MVTERTPPGREKADAALRLTALTAQRFRSLYEVSLPLKPLNIIIGSNGSGKSNLIRLQLTEAIAARAAALAWEHGLRGYAAVHLAVALFWQETISEPITLATFDRHLWQKGALTGLLLWPEDLDQFAGL